MNVKEANKRVQRALRGLKDGQGVIARRNARAKLARELRHLRAAVDGEFPAIRAKGKKQRKRANLKTKSGQELARRRLLREGYIEIGAPEAAQYATSGVRVRTLPPIVIPEKRFPGGSVRVQGYVHDKRFFVPSWVVKVGPDAKRLKLAKRSALNRDAILVEADLSDGTELLEAEAN